ncbi:hypothetical protein Dimus_008835 [Dionaea muscipula]
MSVKLGLVTTIVISSPSMAKEVLQKKDASFSGRSPFIAMTVLDHHKSTAAFSPPNSHWRDLKKILKNHLFSKDRLDATRGVRKRQVEQLLSDVQDCCNTGTSINISQAVFNIYLNFLSNTFFSSDSANKSNLKAEVCELVTSTLRMAGISNIADYFWVLKMVDPQGLRRGVTNRYRKALKLFGEVIVAQRTESKMEIGISKEADIVDVLMGALKDNNTTTIKESELPNILTELLVGGTDTSIVFLEWAMSELLNNPEKMKKAQAELEEVIGKGKAMEEDDIDRLPYLRAIVKETFRLHPPVPFLVPRRTTVDVELSDFTVPENTQVLVNIWSMGRDESLWKNANVFEPERFLGLDIDLKGRDVELLPFGAGRRMCPGLPIAHRMLHLMLGSMLHFFNWKLEDGAILNMDEEYGFTLGKAQPLRTIPTYKS